MSQPNYYPLKYATPKGPQLTCKGWIQEAALRMLLNNFNTEADRYSGEPVTYGARNRSTVNLPALDEIIAVLKILENDETLLIQNGNPLGIMKTHKDVPRILVSNSQAAPGQVNPAHFEGLDKTGPVMDDGLTGGSWIYAGSQVILQENYETYAAIATKYFNGTLKDTLNVTAGLGAMGSAQPLAITMNEGVALIAEVDESQIDKCISLKYLDLKITDIDNAIDQALEAKSAGRALSIGVLCNAVHLLEHLVKRNIVPDTLTDQTPAHDPLTGYTPHQMSYEYSGLLRPKHPGQYIDYACNSMYIQMQLTQELQDRGSITFDYGNNIRAVAKELAVKHVCNFPGFIPAYTRREPGGKNPFCWAALSGDLNDVATIDNTILDMFPGNKGLVQLIGRAKERNSCQGLPARVCLLGQDEKEQAGLAFNELVRAQKVKAPIIINCDHLNAGPVVYPGQEPKSPQDGNAAIAGMPILSALVNTAAGASWVSINYVEGQGMGNRIHTGMAIVADGTIDATRRLCRILRHDPGMGMIRPVGTRGNITRQEPKKYKVNLRDTRLLKEAEIWQVF